VTLKEYLYLFLYNSNKCNDGYAFKSLGLCLECEKEHNKKKVVSWYIKDSYYIKYQSSPNKKEIKINTLSEIVSSATSNASVLSASSRILIPKTNPNKMKCLYQYAVKHCLDPEKFLIVIKIDKKR